MCCCGPPLQPDARGDPCKRCAALPAVQRLECVLRVVGVVSSDANAAHSQGVKKALLLFAAASSLFLGGPQASIASGARCGVWAQNSPEMHLQVSFSLEAQTSSNAVVELADEPNVSLGSCPGSEVNCPGLPPTGNGLSCYCPKVQGGQPPATCTTTQVQPLPLPTGGACKY